MTIIIIGIILAVWFALGITASIMFYFLFKGVDLDSEDLFMHFVVVPLSGVISFVMALFEAYYQYKFRQQT